MVSLVEVLIAFFVIFNFSITTSLYEQQVIALRAPFKPYTLILPVHKDIATGFHISKIRKRTPQLSLSFLVDLNAKFLQVNCENRYLSSTYSAPFCHSTLCARAGLHYCHRCASLSRPGCHNNTCATIVKNPLTQSSSIVELATDVLSIQTINQASMERQYATIPKFLFACSSASFLQGPMPRSVEGIVGLSHSRVSLPNQLSSHFGFFPKFSLCLTSSNSNNGSILFGNSIYLERQKVLAFQSPIYTPLFINSQGEYFIKVRAMRINNNRSSNTCIFSTTRNLGGVEVILSTTTHYTTLSHSLYQIFSKVFMDAMPKIQQVKPVSPFGLCFDTKYLISKIRNIPNIDFILQSKNVKWTVDGENSMVQAREGVSCLAFIDGGSNQRAPIIIGVHQMEDNLLEFDLERSRLGLNLRTFFHGKTCANFTFASNLSP